jgi:predicted nucleic acid-binding protein
MKRIYTDTSVLKGCYSGNFKEYSLGLLEAFKSGCMQLIRSDLVLLELSSLNKKISRKISEVPQSHVIDINSNAAAIELASTYIEYGALTKKYYSDALHIALATLNKADIIASWNFKNIVNFDKIHIYNAINTQLGYQTIEVMTPRLILNIHDL